MSKLRACCVPNCDDRQSRRSILPFKDPIIMKEWLIRIGNPKLVLGEKYLEHQRICLRHFEQDALSIGTHRLLKFKALPTLHLPENQENVDPEVLEATQTASDGGLSMMPLDDPQPSTSVLSTTNATDVAEPSIVMDQDQCDTSICSVQSEAEGTQLLVCSRKKSRFSYLGLVNATRKSQLKGEALTLYKQLISTQRRERRAQKENVKWRVQMHRMKKLVESNLYKHLLNNVTSTTYNFFVGQLKNQKLKPRGRRFTFDEKVFALNIFKQSPKGYRLLSKLFALPARKTLMEVLAKFRLQAGINGQLLDSLRRAASRMTKIDKFCSLVFDEVELQKGLSYNISSDRIDGFEDYGAGRRNNYASHACVFMVRGISRNWKQPVAFLFSGSTIPTMELKSFVKNLIGKIQETSLKLKATICDQGTTNVAAINSLIADTKMSYTRRGEECKKMGFEVNGEEIIPLFDPPHLLKGIRNNLLTKDLKFNDKEGRRKTAKWAHVIEFYKMDVGVNEIRLAHKLTDQHVIPEKIRKMKVKNCSQVFSERLAGLMKREASWSQRMKAVDPEAVVDLHPDASQTADLLLFMDQLFDSVNSNSRHDVKPLRCALTSASGHLAFWAEARKVLRSMVFVGGNSRVVSIKNWIRTLDGIKYLWKDLQRQGLKYLRLRNLNQDCLENFFGCVRSHGFRNNKPTCGQFVHTFKSLLVSNLNTNHTPGFNCENDNARMLEDLRYLFTFDSCESTKQQHVDLQYPAIPMHSASTSRLGEDAQTYVCGYIARRVVTATRKCETCSQILIAPHPEAVHEGIVMRQYSSRSLTLPTTTFLVCYRKCLERLAMAMPLVATYDHLKLVLCRILRSEVDLNILQCDKLCDIFLNIVVIFHIYTYCKNINRILNGEDSRLYMEQDDILKTKARQLAQKKKK